MQTAVASFKCSCLFLYLEVLSEVALCDPRLWGLSSRAVAFPLDNLRISAGLWWSRDGLDSDTFLVDERTLFY